jgi:protein-S-isoprenylcysteine O-methyltransferase Ste14
MQSFARVEILVIWLLWIYPFLFRAPKWQQRASITVFGPTTIGLILEMAGFFIVWFFQIPTAPRASALALIGALIPGSVSILLMWTAVPHLGRQFRIYAGLYSDHQLVRTGPYSVVRHPIYASLLAITLSTGILLTLWQWLLIALAISIVGTEMRVRVEDKLLASRFGREFEDYKAKVPAYLAIRVRPLR